MRKNKILRTLRLFMTRRVLRLSTTLAEGLLATRHAGMGELLGTRRYTPVRSRHRGGDGPDAARTSPDEEHPWIAATLRSREVKRVAALHWNPGDPNRRRIGRCHTYGEERRWYAPIHEFVSEARWTDEWQDLAHEKEEWRARESIFVTMVAKVKRPRPVLAGRHQIRPTQDVQP